MAFGFIAALIAIATSAGVYYQQKKMEAQAKKQANEAKAVQISGHDSNRGLYTVYGKTLVGSTVVWKKVSDKQARITQTGFTTFSAATGSDLTTNKDWDHNRWLYRAVTLCNGPVESVTNVTVDDESYESPRFTNGADFHFATSVSLGPTAGQNFSALRNAYSTDFSTWDSNAVGKGVCYAMERMYLSKNYTAFQGEPQTRYLVKGRKVYDPRKDSTSSAYDSSLGVSSHRADTVSTWQWSDNPVICLLDYLRNEEYGRGLPLSVIDIASIAAAADKCDVLVDVPAVLTNDTGDNVTQYDPETGITYITTPLGTFPYYRPDQETTGANANKQKRFRLNIAVDPAKEILENIQEILNVFRGNLSYANGKYMVHMADVQNPVLTLGDDDIIGGLKIANGDRSQRMNRATVKFINQNKQHKTDQISWPSIDSNRDGNLYATYLSQDEDEKLHRTFTVKGCTDFYQAQDTAEFLVRDSRSNLTVTGTFGSRCFGLVPGDVISLTYDSAGFSGKYFRVLQANIDLVSMNVQLQLKEYDSSVYTWNSTRANEPLGLSWQEEVVNAAPTSPTIGTITTNTRTQGDDSARTTLTIAFSGVPEDAQYAEISWAINGTNDYNTQLIFDTANQTSVEVGIDRDGQTYEIRLRYFAANDFGTLMPSAYATTTHAVASLTGTKLDGIATGATANTGALADLDSVDTAQIDDNAVNIDKLADAIQSTNYSAQAGSEAGWRLTTDGTFTAQDGNFRGGITATSGTFAGSVNVNSSGKMYGGSMTTFNNGSGFFLGYDTDAYKFSVGDSTSKVLTWDGDNLNVQANVVSFTTGGEPDYDSNSRFPTSMRSSVLDLGSNTAYVFFDNKFDQNLTLFVSYYAGPLTSGSISGETNAQNAVMAQLSMQIQYAPNNSGSPGTWTNFGSAAVSQKKYTEAQLNSNYYVKTTDLGGGNFRADLATKSQAAADFTGLGYSETEYGITDEEYYMTERVTQYAFPKGQYFLRVVVTVTDGTYSPYPASGSPSVSNNRRLSIPNALTYTDSDHGTSAVSVGNDMTYFTSPLDNQTLLDGGSLSLMPPEEDATSNKYAGIFIGGRGETSDAGSIQPLGGIWFYEGMDDMGTGAGSLGSPDFSIYMPPAGGNLLFSGNVNFNNNVDVDGTLSINGVTVNAGAVTGPAGSDGQIQYNNGGALGGSSNLTFDDSTNTLSVTNLTVSGVTTSIDTTNLNVSDKNITLNYGSGDTSANADGAGITIQDAVDSSTDATILWDATNDEFDFSHGGSFAGDVTVTSGEVSVAPSSGTAKVRLTSLGTGSEVFSINGQRPGVSNTGFAIRNETDSRNDFMLDGSGNATFAGTISSGAITSSGTGEFTGGGNTLLLKKGTGNASIALAGTDSDPEASALIEGIAGGGLKIYTSTGTISSPSWSPKLTIAAGGNTTIAGDLDTEGNLDLNGYGLTSDDNAKFYVWRAIDNTSSQTSNYKKIARVTGAQSTRFMITLTGRKESYGDDAKGSKTEIYGQLNNDNNYDITYTNYDFSATAPAVTEIGYIDAYSTGVDIYVRVGSFSELAAYGVVSDGSITPDSTSSATTTAPSGYTAATSNTIWTDASFTSTDISNYDSAYNYSQVGHLPLAGGTLTGDVTVPGLGVGSYNSSYDFYNNGTSYLNGAVTVDATATFTDGSEARFGDGNDMALFHSAGVNHLRVNSGTFKLRADDMRFTAQNGTTEFMTLGSSGATFAGAISVNQSANKATLDIKQAGNNWEDGILIQHDNANTGWNLHAERTGSALWFGYNSDTSVALASQSATVSLKLNSDLSATFAGNVGVGKAPGAIRMDVETNVSDNLAAQFKNTHATGSYGIKVMGGDDDDNYSAVFTDKDNATLMMIRGSGKIGINENSPDLQLHIKSTVAGATGIAIENTNNAQNLDIDFYNNVGSAQGRLRYAEGAGAFYLYPNASATAALTATYGGTIGIGDDNPPSTVKLAIQHDGLAVRLDGTANTSRTLMFRNVGSGEGIIQTDGNMHLLQEDANRYMRFSTANTERYRITADGDHLFTIAANAMGKFADNIGEVGDGNFALQISNSEQTALKPFGIRAEDIRFATGSAERLRIDSSGNILMQGSSPEFHFGTSSASHYNWRVAVQEVVDGGFEIASGTQSDGSNASNDSYTTRFFIKGNTGDAYFKHNVFLESGTGGTTSRIILKTTDNADESKFIRTNGYYVEFGGHANEGFKFIDTNGNTLLGLYGGNNALAQQAVFSGDLTVGSFVKSTGSNLKFQASTTHVLNIDLNRKVYPNTNNSTDLGFSTSLAFRDLYLTRNARVAGSNDVSKVFVLPQTGGTARWIKLGNFNASNSGVSLTIDIYTNNGYNASAAQNNNMFLRFKTSNGGSNVSGFYADMQAWEWGDNSIQQIKVVQNSTTSYDFYLYVSTFTGDGSFIRVNHGTSTWTSSMSMQTTDPGGVACTIRRFIYTDTDSNNVTLSGDLNVGAGTKVDATVLIASAAGGDPHLKFNTGAVNRNSFIDFFDRGTLAGSIGYLHNGDTLNFSVASNNRTVRLTLDGSGHLRLYGGEVKFVSTSYDDRSFGIDSAGFYLYNNADARLEWRVDESGNFTAYGNVTAYSDERLKSDIETLDGSKVLKMRGVSYTRDGEAGSGVIAQELEKHAPELVHTANDEMGTKSVAYANLTGYLIEAVKMQAKQIAELQQAIEELKNGDKEND